MRQARMIAPRQAVLSGGRLVIFLAVTHIAVDSLASIPGALLPTLQARFGLTTTGLAMLVAVLSFSSSVTQPVFGTLADRFGRRRVAALGCLLTSALLSLIGVVPSITMLAIVFGLGGVGSAAFHPAGISLARDAHARRQGVAVSLFSAGGTLGIALGPVLVLWLVATFGLGATPWLMVPGLVLGALLYLLIPEHVPLAQRRRQTAPMRVRIVGPIGLLCLAGILNSITVVTFNNAVPLWLVANGIPRDSAMIGWTLAAFSLSAAFGGVLAGGIMHRVDRAVLAAGTMVLAVLPFLAITSFQPGTPLFFIVVMLAGALVQASFPLLVISAQDLAPDAVATVSGMLMGFTTGIAGILYIGIGWLQQVIGLSSAMQLGFLLLIPGAALAAGVFRTHRHIFGRSALSDGAATCPCIVCACAPCRYNRVEVAT